MKKYLCLLALAPFTTQAGMEAFTDESSLEVKATNYYFNLVGDEWALNPAGNTKGSDADMLNWVQTLQADYKSGYLGDFIGIDVGGYAVDPIRAGDFYFAKKFLKGGYGEEGKGFVKAHEYYLKQKFNVGEFDVNLYEGRRILKDFGSLKAEERAVDSAYNGISSEINSEQWNIKLGYMNELSDANSDKSEAFLTKEGNEIDYIATADVIYKNNGNTFRYYIGQSDDYLRRMNFQYSKQLGAKKVSAFIMTGEALSAYEDMDSTYQFFDDTAYHMGADIDFYFPKSFVKVGYTFTQADRDANDGLGRYVFDMTAETRGNASFAAGDARDYVNDGEHMLGVVAFHHITEEVEVGVVARYGFGFEYEGHNLDEWESSLIALWKPSFIPNLSVELVYSKDNSFQKTFNNKPVIVDGDTVDAEGTVYLSKLTYKF